MKRLKNYKYLLWLLALPLLVVTCMSIEDIIHPQNAQVGSQVELQVKIRIVAETERTSKLAFGILAPKMWNIANNATLTLSTQAQYAANVVTNEALTVIPAAQLNPSTGTPWATSFQARFGVLENKRAVEWVVFESSTAFVVSGASSETDRKQIDGTVTIKIDNIDRAVKVNMGYAFCGKGYGFGGDEYPKNDVVASKELEITGGTDPLLDFTIEPPLSTVPSVFGFGDIFSIKYNESVTMTGGLNGQQVYLWGKVVYDQGGVTKDKTVDEIGSKTLMESLGNMGKVNSWQRYIYPKEFFDLPDGAVIMTTYFHFYNADKSIVILDVDENGNDIDFMLVESCN